MEPDARRLSSSRANPARRHNGIAVEEQHHLSRCRCRALITRSRKAPVLFVPNNLHPLPPSASSSASSGEALSTTTTSETNSRHASKLSRHRRKSSLPAVQRNDDGERLKVES